VVIRRRSGLPLVVVADDSEALRRGLENWWRDHRVRV